MADERETYCAMALSRVCFYRTDALHTLFERLGSATAIMENRHQLQDVVPDASPKLAALLADADSVKQRVEEEMEYDRQHGVRQLVLGSSDYPQRLADCPDAPLVLYYKGSADLNCRRVVNIVGTRRCTRYGQDLIRDLVSGLRQLVPNVLIISGLAYGVDICAHREALDNGLPTVGVLAHGIDELYPPAHKQTANAMLSHGGLLTEYFTRTKADKLNFVRRNRIVAGCSDATILIESAAKGGGLITCGIANDYGRSVLAFPGAVKAPYSEGCNNLIRDNGAHLVTSARDVVDIMGWTDDARLEKAEQQGIERQMFPDLSPEQRLVVDCLRQQNDQQVNTMTVKTGLSAGKLMSLLFELEMKGVVKLYAGGSYHLLG